MPQNIKINNVRSLDAKVLLDEYYDFMLYKGEAYGADTTEECLAADFSSFNMGENGKIYSLSSWTGASVDEVNLDDIGLTGIDNGFIKFRKDAISNQDFLNILTGSTYHIDSADTRFFLSPITGNTLEYIYPMSAITDDEGNIQYLSFNGGFYQGFYKLHGFDYQVLPTSLNYGWTLNFKLRPRCDYETLEGTINKKHPENEGMFFYMGTRAENKFWEYYPNSSAYAEEFLIKNADNDGYMGNDCNEGEIYDMYTNHVADDEYMQDELPEKQEYGNFINGYTGGELIPSNQNFMADKHHPAEDEYFADGYFYFNNGAVSYQKDIQTATTPHIAKKLSKCGCVPVEENNHNGLNKTCENYFADSYYNDMCVDSPKAIELDYFMEDAKISSDGNGITDSIGHLFNRAGYFEITTDNKFLFFNCTKTGFTTWNWTEGALVTFTGRTNWSNANYFVLMNRTCTGYTTDTIHEYNEAHEKPYDIYKDIKNNAFGLRITKNGAIGYRYGVLDCETSAANHYSVVEEYSKDGIVKCNEWNDVTVKIVVLNPTYSRIRMSLGSGVTICENTGVTGSHKIKIYVYVNGYLKLVSKELPEFAFRELNDDYQKQEGVPFSISLGGGTQGLMETIGPDYMNTSKYILPLERDFCGSFNGDIKSFKMYDCPLNYSTIKWLTKR